jgi:hypothetical protein
MKTSAVVMEFGGVMFSALVLAAASCGFDQFIGAYKRGFVQEPLPF